MLRFAICSTDMATMPTAVTTTSNLRPNATSLKMLQSKRARTSNGMIAEAEALREKLLIEDERRHGEIAVSLAADVLRYFGAYVA